jgi:hypothetical protein
MRSSISSSEATAEGVRPPTRAAGAAPEHGYWVQPLPERRVPKVAWRTAAAVALVLLAVALGAWEVRMRALGLEAGDLGPTRGAWAIERRKIDRGDVKVAIVGSSRILFGTNLDVFAQVAGVRPVQLALQGSSTRKFMADLAADPNFRGLLVVDATPLNFFRSGNGLFDDALEYYRTQTLTQKSDHWLDQALQRRLAYLDADYRLMMLLERGWRLPERDGVAGPYSTVWKVASTHEDRQTYTWARLQRDERLRSHAFAVWRASMARVPPPSPEEFAAVIEATRRDVAAIRARGGEVVFVRPPSGGGLADLETGKFPRDAAWDRLLAGTGSRGFHFADHEETRSLVPVEESHLSRTDAEAFTRAYAEFVRSVLAARR